MFYKSILVIAAVVFISGCNWFKSSGNKASLSAPDRFNLAEAKGIVLLSNTQAVEQGITTISENRSSEISEQDQSSGQKKLYKVNSEGVYVELTYFDEFDRELSMSSTRPKEIIDLNDNFFLIHFNNMPAYAAGNIEDFAVSYLARKSDGKLFQLPPDHRGGGHSHCDPYCGLQYPTVSTLSDAVNQRHSRNLRLSAGLGRNEIIIYGTPGMHEENWKPSDTIHPYRVFLTDDETLKMVKLSIGEIDGNGALLGRTTWVKRKPRTGDIYIPNNDWLAMNEDGQINIFELSEKKADKLIKKSGENAFLAIRNYGSYSSREEELEPISIDEYTIDESNMTLLIEEDVRQITPFAFAYIEGPFSANESKFYLGKFCDLLFYHSDLEITPTLREYENLPVDIDSVEFSSCKLSQVSGNILTFKLGLVTDPDLSSGYIDIIAHWNTETRQVTELYSWTPLDLYTVIHGYESQGYEIDQSSKNYIGDYVIEYDLINWSDGRAGKLYIDVRTLESSLDEVITEEEDKEIIIISLSDRP